MDIKARMEADRALVEDALRKVFADAPHLGKLFEAMDYSLLAGGKRLRPILALETCRLAGGEMSSALALGCAVEMVHTYSLIHDDLPAMDNDDLRRGRPTSHKVYGEALAILAGDGLLTAAFQVIAQAPGLTEAQRLEAVAALSEAAGPWGMVGGQVLDMAGEGQSLRREDIERLQSLKTGALIRCAARMGCIAAGADEALTQAVDRYAQRLCLAFQVRDDVLDVISSDAALGKSVGSDEKCGKSTFVSLLGLEECQSWVLRLSQEAQAALADYPGSEFLCLLADRLARRDH